MHAVNPTSLLGIIREPLDVFVRYRALILDLTRHDIKDRYAGEFFGVFWFIGQPLMLMGLYVFVFAYIFPARYPVSVEMPGDFTTYILSGLIPWLAFSQAMSAAPTIVTKHGNLVKQVIFPIEVLVVKTVLSISVTQVITIAIMLIYMAIGGEGWPWTLVFLPLLFALQILAMIGICLLLAAVGVYIRDVKEVIQIFLTVGLFIAPIIYHPSLIERLTPKFSWIIYANPFSHLVWCYRDLVYYGRVEAPWSWLIVITLSLTSFTFGYMAFTRLRIMFGDKL